MSDIFQVGNFTLLKEAQAIIAMDPSRDMFEEPTTVWINCDGNKVAMWGDDNDLPAEIMAKIGVSEVVSANLHFNTQLTYGQGIKPMLKVVEGKESHLEECDDKEVLDFFEDNDIAGYFLEQCSDMNAFFNVFPEIILTKDITKIISLRHKEATFSRWGLADGNTGEIIKHFYSGRWNSNTQSSNYVMTDVLNRYNPLRDLNNRIANRKIKPGEARFIIPVNFPTPGRIYYQQPPFWSIFQSGSYDYAIMLWEFKKLLLKQGLAIRYIIYISDKYWDIIFAEEKIDRNSPDKVKARKEEEFQKFRDFLGSSANAGKGIMALKKMVMSGTSAMEEKYITIEEIKTTSKGGEYLEDSSEVNSTMSYAMSVYTQLIGSTPGKTGGSLSGTDKREMYMIKSALMKPYRDRLLRPLQLIKKFNKWPDNLVFTVPDYEFTTLDVNKSGKQLTTPDNVDQ
jgi:hypothetical protein